MAYLPLDPDERNKGQAAVEIIGGRAGKAGASAIQQVMTAFPRASKPRPVWFRGSQPSCNSITFLCSSSHLGFSQC